MRNGEKQFGVVTRDSERTESLTRCRWPFVASTCHRTEHYVDDVQKIVWLPLKDADKALWKGA